MAMLVDVKHVFQILHIQILETWLDFGNDGDDDLSHHYIPNFKPL